MTRIARKAAALAATVAVLTLAACGTTAAKDYVTGEDVSLDVKEVTITLSDTRRVYCIILDPGSRLQAMSCDWAHADGSDDL
ncbi:hypothetical protein [Bifidobacterium phasiani]|uniref:Uncharacterized protein n=1 Tax=Bifidobacterium phasiani TaxID=2834431 RepID=A0ABS6W678_9BIFI|nr:hypothetical protein [Bifidobacterium phasiani]MBW3081990.1 hypothetical protein [Bifidobacterium phasiani]